MRRISLLVGSVLSLAVLVWATDYTVTLSTGNARQDQYLNTHRLNLNADTCAAAHLPSNCTQAQARARTPGVNIYSSIEDYIQRYWGPQILAAAKADQAEREAHAFCRWWNNSNTTRAQQDAVCTAIGLEDNCELCS